MNDEFEMEFLNSKEQIDKLYDILESKLEEQYENDKYLSILQNNVKSLEGKQEELENLGMEDSGYNNDNKINTFQKLIKLNYPKKSLSAKITELRGELKDLIGNNKKSKEEYPLVYESFEEVKLRDALFNNKNSKDELDELDIIPDYNALEYNIQNANFYILRRTSSNLSAYSDLIEDMTDDQIDEELFRNNEPNYEIISIKSQTQTYRDAKSNLKELRKSARVEQDKKNPRKKGEKKTEQQATKDYNEREKLPKIKKAKKLVETEKDKIEEKSLSPYKTRLMHLFRGKCLNSKMLNTNGKLVNRSKIEVYRSITKKYKNVELLSDGIKNEYYQNTPTEKRLKEIKIKTRKFLEKIKNKKETTSLFNAGEQYDSAVKKIMNITGAKGNTVVATSKFPWVAFEYIAGNMGGASGGDRKIGYGYKKNGKAINRCLGNSYAISLLVEDYKKLRDDNDLIDVNIDIEKGMKCNTIIEEVTFNGLIPKEMARGSLPMVLPRFDRDYTEMLKTKKAKQYEKIFNLDEKRYNYFKKKLSEDEFPIGELVEHLIDYYGKLLLKIVITADKRNDYNEKFIITKNDISHSSCLNDNNNNGKGLKKRETRQRNAKKLQKGYFTQNVIQKENGKTQIEYKLE
jgi:hypothetical protein